MISDKDRKNILIISKKFLEITDLNLEIENKRIKYALAGYLNIISGGLKELVASEIGEE